MQACSHEGISFPNLQKPHGDTEHIGIYRARCPFFVIVEFLKTILEDLQDGLVLL